MPDLAPLFGEMLQALKDGMATLETELEGQSKAGVVDRHALQRLAEVSADFWQQVDALFDMMLEQGTEPLMLSETATLAGYFEATTARCERLARSAPESG